MGCFSGCAGDNWWWIIVLILLFVCNDDCSGCLDCIRDLVCDNVWWIVALFLICSSRNSDTSDMSDRRCNTCGCGCN